MYTSKFIVFTILLIHYCAENAASCDDLHWNCTKSHKRDPIDTISRNLRQKRFANNEDSANEMTIVDELQFQSDSIQHRLKHKKHRLQPREYSNSSLNDINDDDDFRFLVTGGYRPEKNLLVKYVVSIRSHKERKYFGDNHFCGGAIISTRSILTAAHCLFINGAKLRPSRVKIVAGTPRRLVKTGNTQELNVDKVRPHPKYSPSTLANDIGILRLKESIRLDDTFATIIPIVDRDPTAGLLCTVVGWGTVIQYGPTPDEAVNGDVTINTNAWCSKIAGFKKGMVCASNANDFEVDSCQGDSGGPLMCDGKVVGIVSFGTGCGEPDSAGVYTDVYRYREWIARNTANKRSQTNASPYRLHLIALTMMCSLHIPMI
ncbi:serine protease 1 [Drosophila sulfurigaster albostrigata]|uniref:serine protease 1 n=1 Tax=Drosophila sulfurigaster albostrigata TaxID=89887 RepID=UPI002D21A339|nr:serine protease 1 [Drosophila sulfurigaster albostrigata]